MKKYTYKYVNVPVVGTKKGIIMFAEAGATFDECKRVIDLEAENGWRLKQVVAPFNEKVGTYSSHCYEIIFEKEVD